MGCFSPDLPPAPDYAAAQTAGVVADAKTLPYRNMIEAARKLGQKITVKNPETGAMEEVDFTGLGDADISGQYSDKMAAKVLEIQQKYGPEFIKSAKEQLAASDPQGVAARQRLFDEVMADQDRQPDLTLSKTIQQQMLDELNQGGATDAATNREIEQFLTAQQSARGGGYGKADEYERAMGVGQAAEARKAQRKQQALAFLTSGATPDDVSFRRGQQNKANLSAFLSGTTPTAQFQQLSGAQQQAAPFVAQGGVNQNPNAGAQGAQFAQNVWQTQANNAAQEANPWLQGIGLGLKGIGTVAQAGGAQGFKWW